MAFPSPFTLGASGLIWWLMSSPAGEYIGTTSAGVLGAKRHVLGGKEWIRNC